MASSTEPKTTLVIPHYNRGDLLIETMASIAAQTDPRFQCIIIDDGSTDGSFERCLNYIQDDKRFIVKRRSAAAKGAPVCRNEGLSMATTPYLMFLDSDDLLAADCLKRRVEYMDLAVNEASDFIVTQTALFQHDEYKADRLKSSLSGEDDLTDFLNMRGWGTSSPFFRTSFIQQFSWDEKAKSWQDIEFHIRLLLHNPRYLKYPASLPDVYKRLGGGDQISATNQGFDRLYSLLSLFIRLEKDLDRKQIEYQDQFQKYYFKFLEISARLCSYEEFTDLMSLWSESSTYSFRHSQLFRRYLSSQANISKFGLYKLGSIPYYLIRMVFPNRFLDFHAKHVPIDPPIAIRRPLKDYESTSS